MRKKINEKTIKYLEEIKDLLILKTNHSKSIEKIAKCKKRINAINEILEKAECERGRKIITIINEIDDMPLYVGYTGILSSIKMNEDINFLGYLISETMEETEECLIPGKFLTFSITESEILEKEYYRYHRKKIEFLSEEGFIIKSYLLKDILKMEPINATMGLMEVTKDDEKKESEIIEFHSFRLKKE